MTYVIDFCDVDKTMGRLVGGKGANLGELSRINGINVPDGFCVTTESYALIKQSGGIPDEIMALIASRIDRNTRYAVRSSATAEDLEDSSFAGQQDSYLNIQGLENIEKAILDCFDSLYTERAIAYRRQNQIDEDSLSMSVVVQKMVNADYAGVMFTADPLSGDRKTTVIESVEGLGEELVSGRKTPGKYKVRGGKIESDRANIDSATVLALSEIGGKIQAHYNMPMDIEWCVEGGTILIVQARAITTLFPIPENFDGKNHIYMSFSHQQMMTDAIKPLGMGLFLTLGTDGKLQIIEVGGRMYGDLSSDLCSFISKKIVLTTFGLSDPLSVGAIKNILNRPDFMRNIAKNKTRFFSMGAGYFTPSFFVKMITVPFVNDPKLVPMLMIQAEEGTKKLAEELDKISGAAVFDFIKEYQSQLRKDLYEPTGMSAVLQSTFSNAWLNKHIEKWTGEKNVADILTQSAPYNVTSEMGLDLLDVSDVVRKYPDQIEVLKAARDDSFFNGLNAEVSEAIHDYLRKYGMRCPGEIDITRPRFNEKPSMLVSLIISNIQNFEIGERERQFNRGLEKYEKKEQELLEKIGKSSLKKKKLLKKISLLRNFAGFREYPKYMLICRYWIIKQALMREAEKLTESGAIAQKEDVCFLTFEEFRAAVQTGEADRKLIEERKKRHAYHEKLTPPRIMTSDGESASGEYDTGDKPDGALLGVAVSSGIAEGTARVVERLGETTFGPDDVLVTKFTDPSWTPVFVSIKGLVTEVGGTMTHGTVIAREYGLPAVVSVENATKLIEDGQRIRVNGTSGYVEILDV